MTQLAILGLVLILPVVAACDPGALQPEDEYVAVVGRSSLSVEPDQATLSVIVSATDETVVLAKDQVGEKVSVLVNALTEFGVPAEDLSTEDISVRAAYEEVLLGNEVIDKQVGFEARYALEIRTEKLDELGALLDVVAEHASYFDNLDYSLKDKASLFQQVRNSAINDARIKAQEYASAVSRQLGRVTIVEETDTNRYRLSPTFRRGFSKKSRSYDEIIVTASKRQSGFTIPIIPPNVEVDVEIFAKFKLE